MAISDDVWLEQVPPSLRRAHRAARWAYKWLRATYVAGCRLYDLPKPDDGDLSREESEALAKERSVCGAQCTHLIVVGRERLAKADRSVRRVAEEFTCAAHYLMTWELHRRSRGDVCYGMIHSRSLHEFAVVIASEWLHECECGIAAKKKKEVWLSRVSTDELEALNDQDIADHVQGVELALEQCDAPPTEVAWMMPRLASELRRAHKRRSRPKPRFACDIPHSRKGRPTYARDHAWLDWTLNEGLTPAKIRDRWNRMAQVDREEICPQAAETIGRGEPARDRVKKALLRAKDERRAERKRSK